MDTQKYLLLLHNEDKTADVAIYRPLDRNRIIIFFKGKDKGYTYSINNVVFEKKSNVIDVSDKVVYVRNNPLFGSEKILIFDKKAKVIFKGGESQIFDKELIKYDCNYSEAHKVFHYWTDIATYIKKEDENIGFLKKQFSNLNCIKEESILNHYLHERPVDTILSVKKSVIFPFKFNLSQKKALDNALKYNISVIEGPPGTGKTQTILNIIANLAIIQNKTVAVVSGNNSAVQNVKEKLEKENYDFLVALLGNAENRNHFFANLPMHNVTEWKSDQTEAALMQKINNLNDQINRLMVLNNQKAQIQQELSAYLLEQKHFNNYYENQNVEDIKQLSFYKKDPKRIISFLADNQLTREQGKSNSLFYKAKLFLKYGFTDFKGLKENETDIILNMQKNYYIQKILLLKNKLIKIQDELEQEKFTSILQKHEEYSKRLFRHKLYEKYHRKKKIDLDSKNYKEYLNFKKFIDYYPVILSTTHSLRNCIPKDYLLDYVIIDESSQVDLLSAVLALSCCKNVIIVGDTKQLPQIIDNTIQDKLKNNDIPDTYNYFKHNIMSSFFSAYEGFLPQVILKEHYRCHPKIIEFCNQKYYAGELIPFTEESDSDVPLVLYRTSQGNHMRMVTRGEKKGRFNQRELDVIKNEILNNSGLKLGKLSEIGFATPYRKQVEKAVSELSTEIESDTIHKYQGREKPTMIISTVLDQSQMGKNNIRFVDDPCIINVAVSRAQKQFILVTDNSLFTKESKEVADLIRYIEYNALDKNIINSEIVSVFDLLYREYSEKLISLQEKLLQISKFKSENIMWTIICDMLNKEDYKDLEVVTQVKMRNLLKNTEHMTDEERNYIKNNSSVDFVIYRKLNKQPVLIIEVDGFSSHENNPIQLKRDELKDSIMKKYKLDFIRFSTTGSNEEEKLQSKLNEVLN